MLTHRVAHLLAAVGARPNEILAITFTNKAAQEMKERVERALGPVARAIWIMTFHAACGRILRREAERLGYRSNFTIYDQADQVRLVKACLEELERDPKRFVPRGIHAQISNAKNQLISPDEYASRVASFYDQTVADVYQLYQRRLFASNAVDFDDLLMLTVDVLQRFPEARERWAKAFRYVLVDEYQDTNHAQYVLLKLLCQDHQNLMAVGDPDQSVYGFRGADIRNILEFEHDFPDTRVIALEQNYRSTNTILAAANAVISHNRERKEKNLWSELGEGELVHVVETEDEHAEARFVAAEIAALIGGGYSATEIAVVYRTNAQSRVLEDVLVRQGIDYQVIGGPRFYERAEIKDAVAYLQVLDNPYRRREPPADREPAETRDRRHLAGAAAGLRGRARHLVVGGDGASRGGRPRAGLDARGQGFPQRDGVAARDGERLDRRRACRGGPPAHRLPRGTRGGADDRSARADREPRGARRRRARVRRRGAGAVALRLPAGDLAVLRPGRPPRRRGRSGRPGHAADAAQREGARVSRGLHARARGGDLPARRARSRRTRSRRSVASATSA